TAPTVTGTCPDGCRLCADACPVNALDVNGAGSSTEPFPRHEVRCQWARVMGMTAGEGSAMAGWRLPDLPVPDTLDDASRQAALAQKDPIQVRCYQRPNMADTQVERCLQACPFAH
ncbi:MAG TPA: 4Fe-4S binding protein, partial [Lentisphaeria bacterium]|nr:4Fe-4S binding protein [Lentisphaeria bacterium]